MREARKPSEARPGADGEAGAAAGVPGSWRASGVVLAGGSAAAAWKAELLSAAGARVEVYAAEVSNEMRQMAADASGGAITVVERAWTPDDLKGAAVAIGAFEDDEGAAAFAAAARSAGVPVNVIDRPAFCDFSFGAIVNRSPLVIGISTDGAAPVFAQAIRARLEALLPGGFAHWAAAAARWRSAVQASGLSFSGRRKFWRVFTAHAVKNPDGAPTENDFTPLHRRGEEPGRCGRDRLGDPGRRRSGRSGTPDHAAWCGPCNRPTSSFVRRSGVAGCPGLCPPRGARCWSARPGSGRPASGSALLAGCRAPGLRPASALRGALRTSATPDRTRRQASAIARPAPRLGRVADRRRPSRPVPKLFTSAMARQVVFGGGVEVLLHGRWSPAGVAPSADACRIAGGGGAQ